MLNEALKVREDSGIEGAGLFADRPIPAGEVLFRIDETKPLIHLYELVDWPPAKRARFFNFANQVGADAWCFRQGNIKFMNHSCDPNAWWAAFGTLTARRDIAEGEEVTYDYSTTDITLSYKMKCLCGSKSCRGIVTNKDYLNPDFRKQYDNRFPEHVLEAIRRAESGEPDKPRGAGKFPPHIVEAIKRAKLNEAEFRRKYGDQYVFEMVRQLILKGR